MLTAAKTCATKTCLAAILLVAAATMPSHAQHDKQVMSQAQKQQQPLLKTMEELVSIESGSRDIEGLDRIAKLIAGRLQELGGQVELVEPSDIYKMEDTPDQIGKIVRATFTGTGTRKILLLAHMDTVYPRGMLAKQPFRIKNGRAYGVGIADDKQGIAVIIHAIAMLRAMNFRDYGTLTVLINADEEISSPGSRSLITRLGAEHDVVLSFEASFAIERQGRARDRRHRLGHAERAGQGIARRQRARARRQRAVRAVAPDPADARPLRSRDRGQDELDGGARRARAQHDPARRAGHRRRARAAGRRL